MNVINRSEVAKANRYRYSIETKAPNGDWVRSMGGSDLEKISQHAEYLQKHHYEPDSVRLVDEWSEQPTT